MDLIVVFFIGLIVGKMLTFPVLLSITGTCICILASLYPAKTLDKLTGLIILIFVGNGTMWITFYVTTNKSWLGTFFNIYFFR